MDCLIGLDIGTTAIKGVLLTVDGRVLNTVTGGYNYYGENNQKLLNPEEFLEVCFSVIKRLTDRFVPVVLAEILFCSIKTANLLLL